MINSEFIGQFEVQSDKLRVTDPCYDKGTWCSGLIEDVKPGLWDANVKTMNNRVAELIAYHTNVKSIDSKKNKWEEQEFEIGVDSGQCGIFEDKFYPDGETGDFNDDSSFYGKCCNLTLNKGGVGVLDFGVVSTSGWGDGTYFCYTIEEKGIVVGVKVVFMEDESEDYDFIDDYSDYDDYSQEDY